jgi:hypothetical protein
MQRRQMNKGAARRIPGYRRLRLYFVSREKREPVWKWRGSMFQHNKRRKPRRMYG